MKLFFDTEFIECVKQRTFLGVNIGRPVPTIDLLSIGLVRQDGVSFESLNAEAELDYAWKHEFVRENVLAKIYEQHLHGDMRNHYRFSLATMRWVFRRWGMSRADLATNLARLAGAYRNIGTGGMPLSWQRYDEGHRYYVHAPEFWAYYADYDWVAWCQLFGSMNDLPVGLPKFCADLHQRRLSLGISNDEKRDLCPDWASEHSALSDAKWNYQLDACLDAFEFHYHELVSPRQQWESSAAHKQALAAAATVTPHLFDFKFPCVLL